MPRADLTVSIFHVSLKRRVSVSCFRSEPQAASHDLETALDPAQFVPADPVAGDAACRGSHASDKNPANYFVTQDIWS